MLMEEWNRRDIGSAPGGGGPTCVLLPLFAPLPSFAVTLRSLRSLCSCRAKRCSRRLMTIASDTMLPRPVDGVEGDRRGFPTLGPYGVSLGGGFNVRVAASCCPSFQDHCPRSIVDCARALWCAASCADSHSGGSRNRQTRPHATAGRRAAVAPAGHEEEPRYERLRVAVQCGLPFVLTVASRGWGVVAAVFLHSTRGNRPQRPDHRGPEGGVAACRCCSCRSQGSPRLDIVAQIDLVYALATLPRVVSNGIPLHCTQKAPATSRTPTSRSLQRSRSCARSTT
jgi:hypothetical protein